MPVYSLGAELLFPPPGRADQDGLLAVGGDLRPERLMLAYASGIFPWYSEGEPILWWSPPVRPVLHPAQVYVGRSLAKVLRRGLFELRMDTAFAEVIASCARAPRRGQGGTWITAEMRQAYEALHERGVAHSVEAWQQGRLVGGLYGVALGGAFFGESMFARVDDASKVAFVALCRHLAAWDFGLIDSQVSNAHTERFGTEEIPRATFLRRVRAELEKPGQPGRWTLDPSLLSGDIAR